METSPEQNDSPCFINDKTSKLSGDIADSNRSLSFRKRLFRHFIICLFIAGTYWIPTSASSQIVGSHDMDSLWAVWNDNAQHDTARVNALYQVCWNGFMDISNDSLFNLAQIVYDMADSMNNKKFQVDALWFQAASFLRKGDRQKDWEYSSKSLNLSIEIGYKEGMARGYAGLGLTLLWEYKYTEAIEYMEKGLRISEEIGYLDEMAEIYNYFGHMYRDLGNFELSKQNFKKSLKVSEEMGDQRRIGYNHANLAYINALQGEYSKALETMFRLKIRDEKYGQRIDMASGYSTIGRVLYFQGNYSKSTEYLKKAIRLWEELGLTLAVAECHILIGQVFLEQDNYSFALENFERGLVIFEEKDNKTGIAGIISNIGLLHYKLGNDANSLEYFTQSNAIYDELGMKPEIANVYSYLGNLFNRQRKYPQALEYYQQSLEINIEIGKINAQSDNYRDLGVSFMEQGNYITAAEFFEKSRVIREKIGDQKGMAEIYIDHGDLFIVQNKIREGVNWCQKGYDIAVKIGVLKLEQEAVYCLYKAHKALGNGVQALEYHENYLLLQDSLKTDEASRKLQQMEFNRQHLADSLAMVEEKLKTELAYQETLSSEKNTRNTMALAGIVVLAVAVGLFGRMRFVRKTNKKLEEKNKVIAKEKERAEESERAKEHFFDNVSHEFRTPLTLILGPLEEALGTTTDENIKPRLQTMQRNALRLHEMINELLNLSKLEFGKIKLQAKEENIVKLTGEYLQSFESLADQKKIKLGFKSSAKSYKAWVDAEQFRKILANLLSNAFKFTTEGGKVNVSISSVDTPLNPSSRGDRPPAFEYQKQAEGESQTPPFQKGVGGIPESGILVTITDTGIGIPKEKLPHIFDRFFQVGDPSQAHHAGTGIGLALTKELVGLHHGTISVESEKGKGTSFIVFIPFGSDHLTKEEIRIEKVPEKEETKPEWAVEKEISGHVIEEEVKKKNELPILLIVEDNKDMRSYIKSHLDKDYTIIEASDGEEGLQKTIEQIPDLVISDVMMPKLDGYQMTDMIKADQRTSHIPVLILTARSSVESRIEGLETGADAYLIKPFNARELKVRIKKLIEQRQKLREHFSNKLESLDDYLSKDPKLTSMDQQFVQNAQDVVNKYLSDSDFDAKTFASGMALSRVQLHRKIKALTNKTTTEFIRTIRLNRAALLLKNHTGNVSDIAFEVGFSSLSYFTKVFKEQFGKTPSEFAEPG